MSDYVIGVDYGTDSVRSVIIDAADGTEISSAVQYYRRWKDQLYCDAHMNQFRQHPLDYLESFEHSIKEALGKAPEETALSIRAITVDTTGSTSAPADVNGIPLALLPEFEHNPNAMFFLWKDHTAIKEAEEINKCCRNNQVDYTRFSGGVYSSEWFWSNVLYTGRKDPSVVEAAYTWVEHCDWIPAVLTGVSQADQIKRSRCSAGHKAMWHEDFGGYPAEKFLANIDPFMGKIRASLPDRTFTSDISAGMICREWAQRLGVPETVCIGIGALDAHMGAVGAEIKENSLVRIMGTSTCDMVISSPSAMPENPVRGISGQVDGSVVPGLIGMEAGQSAFGDLFAWFMRLMLWPLEELKLDGNMDDYTGTLFAILEKQAGEISDSFDEYAIDWFNGRRTPDSNQVLKGAFMGLNLGSDAPRLYKALIESAAYGTKAIVDRFAEEGIQIDTVIAIGGVAQKSPLIMQTVSDVLSMPITVAASEQTCALGSAMFASVVAGIHKDIATAQDVMGAGFSKTYEPDPGRAKVLEKKFERYMSSGQFIESCY